MRIKRALISVSDKTGILEFAQGLAEQGVAILSSGGTARSLARSGVQVETVSHVTGVPEMLDGRVKTLHPKIHGGILADRSNAQHLSQLKEQNISPIDLVVCNLYPFAETVARDDVGDADIIEQIDIGGPAMVRAAAKNHRWVAVAVNPERYNEILDEMRSTSGALSEGTRTKLAAEAFAHTAAYDIAIANWMNTSEALPPKLFLAFEHRKDLRYGENPHQEGAFYHSSVDPEWIQHSGKELSFTNILDFDSASRLIAEFEQPAAAIIKHTNPSGVAVAENIEDAYRRAVECDPRSAFGGIVALNREVDDDTARLITEIFTEIVIAPKYSSRALQLLKEKKNLRIIELGPADANIEFRSIGSGVLAQSIDRGEDPRADMIVAGTLQPFPEDWDDLLFAWKVVRHVKSNAVVLAAQRQAVGIGAGQMSRVEAVELAARRAGDRAKGTVCATDGFFPKPDGIEAAAEAGVRAIIHPGGSVRDSEVIAAADQHGIPMVFAGRRHFRH